MQKLLYLLSIFLLFSCECKEQPKEDIFDCPFKVGDYIKIKSDSLYPYLVQGSENYLADNCYYFVQKMDGSIQYDKIFDRDIKGTWEKPNLKTFIWMSGKTETRDSTLVEVNYSHFSLSPRFISFDNRHFSIVHSSYEGAVGYYPRKAKFVEAIIIDSQNYQIQLDTFNSHILSDEKGVKEILFNNPKESITLLRLD